MSDWLNHVAIATPRNGTTTHTVTPSSGTVVAGTAFTSTAGRFLLCVVEGAVTSTTPSGWTLPTNGSAINNTGLYVWYRASAAGSDSITTTHNGSNYPVVFDFYEFAAGTTWVGAQSSISNGTGATGPNLTGLTGTNWIAGAFGSGIGVTGGSPYSLAWSAGTEVVDTFALQASGTDGYLYGLTEFNADTSTSKSSAATWSFTAGGSLPTAERLMFAVKPAASGGSVSPTANVAISTAGVLGRVGSSTTAAAVAISTAGFKGTLADSSVATAVSISTAGVLGRATGTSLPLGVSVVTSGTRGASTGSSVSPGVSISTSGTVTGAGAGSVNMNPAVTITTSGTRATAGSATRASAVGITTSGSTGKAADAARSVGVGISTAGVVMEQQGVAVMLGVSVSTAGVVTRRGSTAVAPGVTIVTSGTVASLLDTPFTVYIGGVEYHVRTMVWNGEELPIRFDKFKE